MVSADSMCEHSLLFQSVDRESQAQSCPLRDPWSRSVLFSPTDEGVPASRPRVYSWWWLQQFISPSLPQASLASLFKDMFFKKCVADASLYMVQWESDVKNSHRQAWQRSHMVVEVIMSDSDDEEDQLTGSSLSGQDLAFALPGPLGDATYRQRLLRYKELTSEKGKKLPCELVPER